MDIIGAVVLAAFLVTLVGVIARLSQLEASARWGFYGLMAGWAAIVVTIGLAGGFAPGALGPVPTPVVVSLLSLAALFGGWFLLPRFREALLSLPLPALVGLNAGRLAGVFFLLLAATGRLSNPFAASAGWGDILVGSTAAILTILLVTRSVPRVWVRAWNILGALDLIAAVSLGTLSAQGTPWRVFTEAPGVPAITELPWVLIPTMLIPIFLLIHFTVARKLHALGSGMVEPAARGSRPAMAGHMS